MIKTNRQAIKSKEHTLAKKQKKMSGKKTKGEKRA
jgi:hypothetical protein